MATPSGLEGITIVLLLCVFVFFSNGMLSDSKSEKKMKLSKLSLNPCSNGILSDHKAKNLICDSGTS